MDKYVNFVLSLEIRGYKLNEQEISDVLKLQSSEFYDDSNMKKTQHRTSAGFCRAPRTGLLLFA